jgi:outer membrane lipoprotein-sorting protein
VIPRIISTLNVARIRTNRLRLLCAACLPLLASNAAHAQYPVERDQQALTIVTQTIACAGGPELLTSIQDVTETGTVTYYWADQVAGTVTVKSRGLHEFRIDADIPSGTRTTVVSGDGGSLIEADGRNTPIYRQSANDLGSLPLPYLRLIGALQDSSTSIVYGGLVTHNGASAYDIRLQKVYTAQQDPNMNRGTREARDFYIDPETFLIGAVSDRIHFGGLSDEGIPHEILYSNYQSENGIIAPLTITETVRGVNGFTMMLSQVTFNSGLADTDFAW